MYTRYEVASFSRCRNIKRQPLILGSSPSLGPQPLFVLVRFDDGLWQTPAACQAFQRGWVTLNANFRWKRTSPPTFVGVGKLEFLLPQSEDRVILSSFVWVGYEYVTDGRTDRRTELAWLISHSALQAVRPRCKKIRTIAMANQNLRLIPDMVTK